MGVNYGFGIASTGQKSSVGVSQSSTSIFGRVVDIILDSSHPKYKEKGESIAINGIFYAPLAERYIEDTSEYLPFAYQKNTHIQVLPLKGEIIEIQPLPSEDTRDSNYKANKMYWTSIVSMWNHPHHSAYPDTLQFPEQKRNIDLGKGFTEQKNINPLQAFPGDTIIQGRLGQSIRFTGTNLTGKSNPWVDASNKGKPLIIISNGQIETKNGDDTIIEDINKDPSSIYLTSNHKIALKEANNKRESWKKKPETADTYKGTQILLNSGRLFFNARDESILLSANTAIGLNSKSISLDGKDYVALDATKIYLGVDALKKEQEPVLKGKTTTDWLEDFIGQFDMLLNTLKTPGPPPAYIASVVAIANAIKPAIPILKQSLPNLHSRKVFTE